ncbi:hypothetical protein DPMN_159823 [Dreissena polymorpha]|uniref:Uncharacterized protein n=1 Tax=Dreissena polymorpha TaxID=45954 RepID=A0A9D4EJQ7_DREPO|nr:hypothetical protein DPMN_159823 [Dreissena polymorpha]
MFEELHSQAPMGLHSVPVRQYPPPANQLLPQVVDGHDAEAGRGTERALGTRS